MKSELVIVESPAKAKTIERFLGSEYEVASSIGHIRDMPKKGLGLRGEDDYEPLYEIPADKRAIVKALKEKAKRAARVWLATDEDREGEAIAWHLFEALDLDPQLTRRIVFNEITKNAVLHAIANPREIDMHLVNAQQARRVLDRLVGFELSPLLWRKIIGARSAGRVQSPTVRLIVEREREIRAFIPQVGYKAEGTFASNSGQFTAKLLHDCDNETAFVTLLHSIPIDTFVVVDTKQTRSHRSPPPPFTTSSLQQEAGNRLSFSVARTMRIAQDLYRRGLITYMRTDSVNLSEDAITAMNIYIQRTFGENYARPIRYKTKVQRAQEAHEAIRPTDCTTVDIEGTDDEQRIYRLIHHRAVASQMAQATFDNTAVVIDGAHSHWQAKGQVMIFDGFLRLTGVADEKNALLPALTVGDSLLLQSLLARETFTRAKPRYSEAALVRTLEELGIGRPSTFATILSTIQDRGYVEKRDDPGITREYTAWQWQSGAANGVTTSRNSETIGQERAKLFPTDLADLVSDFLTDCFSNIVNYDFTAQIEQSLDTIAAGTTDWKAMIADFHHKLQATVADAAQRSRKEIAGARVIGIDPDSGREVSARMGRYGPFVQIGTAEEAEKPRFAALQKGQRIDSITLEEALALFALPRVLGETDEGDVIKANIGRFGPYVQYGKRYVSLGKHDPYTVDLDTAKRLIAEKEKRDDERVIRTFPGSDIQVLNGHYGPYITNGKKRGKGQINVTIKKVFSDREPASLTLDECEQALQAKKDSPPSKRGRKARQSTEES